ncbi:MAG: hypothetical protein U9Q80_07605 [Bacillota bacterium]|nr:hypothetical protein [Bacillota bacterium]
MIYQGGQVVKYNGQSMPYSIYLYECDCGEKMLMTGLPHMYGYTIQEYWYDTEFEFQLDVFGQGYYELDMYDGHESDASTLPGYRFYDNPEW